MTSTQTEPRICACGCGQEVVGSRAPAGKPAWKRGHKMRTANGKLTPLPGPADDLDGEDIDAGEVSLDGLDVPDWVNVPLAAGDAAALADAMRDNAEEPEPEIRADRPPGRLTEPRTSGKRSGPAKTRVTAALRKDVEAKIRFVLLPAGQAWAIRDGICGGTFAAQEPEISAALAEIVCDSPDLLGWFTGPAGGFMKYFRLLVAIQPVGFNLWAHHVAHATFVPADPNQPPQQEAYAA